MPRTLDDVHAVLIEIRDLLRAKAPAEARGGAAPRNASGGEVANDRELDSEWGNPQIRKDPPRWNGPSFVGCNYSDATPDYLESLAGFLDWRAAKDEESGRTTAAGKPAAPYSRRDAARARGWAQRLRNGWQRSAAAPAGDVPADDFGGTDDIPF